MQCPYCKKEVSESNSYCPACGMDMSSDIGKSRSVDEYWTEVNKATTADQEKFKEVQKRVAGEIRSTRRKVFVWMILACAAIVAIALFMRQRNNINAEVLLAAHNSMIGKTYSDIEQRAFTSGQKCDRTVVTITSDQSLKYCSGIYIAQSGITSSGGYSLSWKEYDVPDAKVYSYNLSISFWGEVSISINGKRYVVNLNDDNTVSSIDFYS